MTYKMFIDDERTPPDDGQDWVICRTSEEVITSIHKNGFPSFISWDHDLGEDQPSGLFIAKILANKVLDGIYEMPDNFSFYVHSQNPVGAENIRKYLDQFLSIHKETKHD